ncbi:hypothetical protein CEXT_248031 [Caerostris extrusa]|uniref:Uncharacterized protein n=1 Tax=Caerostris extrusa TaxID=172846 RepID=A0AAV4U6E7_CAEEX|nr:hypothetical protein CEXT_248031 [Caerostris extrusa]
MQSIHFISSLNNHPGHSESHLKLLPPTKTQRNDGRRSFPERVTSGKKIRNCVKVNIVTKSDSSQSESRKPHGPA